MIFRQAEWPHGLRCGRCEHRFVEGESYSEELDGFAGGAPVVLLVCTPCALHTPPRPDLKEVS